LKNPQNEFRIGLDHYQFAVCFTRQQKKGERKLRILFVSTCLSFSRQNLQIKGNFKNTLVEDTLLFERQYITFGFK